MIPNSVEGHKGGGGETFLDCYMHFVCINTPLVDSMFLVVQDSTDASSKKWND